VAVNPPRQIAWWHAYWVCELSSLPCQPGGVGNAAATTRWWSWLEDRKGNIVFGYNYKNDNITCHATKWAGQVIFWCRDSARCTEHGISLSPNFKLLQHFCNGWSYALQIWQMGRAWQGSPQGVKNFPWKGPGLGHVTLLKILNPFNISGRDETTLFKFGKYRSTTAKVTTRGKKKFLPKEAWSYTLLKFGKCVDHTGKKSPKTGVVWVTWPFFLIFNPLKYFCNGWTYVH